MKVFRIALMICAICCIAWPAFATSSRVASMGGGDDYFEDVNNMLRWYGSLASYGGTALFEFENVGDYYSSNASRRAAAAIAELGHRAAWGVGGVFMFDKYPDEVIRLAWGKPLGVFQLGLQYRLNWATDRVWTMDRYYDYESVDQTFGLGGRLELGDRTYLDAAVDLVQTYRIMMEDSTPLFDTGYDTDSYSARIRVFHGISDQTVIVPVLLYRRALHPEYDWDLRGFYDRDLRDFGIGVGWNHLPDTDTMIVGSFTYNYTRIDEHYPRFSGSPHAYTEARNTYTIRFGVEHRMLSWLSLRAGVWQMLWNSDEKTQSTAGGGWSLAEPGSEDMDLSLGLAAHFGPFDVDMVFNDTTPFNVGGLFAQTDDNSSTTWSKITLQYVF